MDKLFTLLKYNYLLRSFISKVVKPIFYLFGNPYIFFPIQHGSWLGNDTLWRTILDLNAIIRYADKNGKISTSPQRKFFFFIDGIIAGEGEGPVQSKKKHLGLIAASDSSVKLDRFLSKIMGFDPNQITHIKRAEERNTFMLDYLNRDVEKIYSNIDDVLAINLNLKPPRGWKKMKLD